MGLLTTGDLDPASLAAYARTLTESNTTPPKDADLIAAFEDAQIPTTPYAFARDGTGQSTRALIAADAFAERDEPVIMSDGDWVRLQGVCNT